MKKRDFLIGIGTVATISGVASATAASFAESVGATSDFRVVVEEGLTLKLGNGVPSNEELTSEESWSDESLGDFDDIEFEDDDDGQLAYIDDIESEPENGEINIELAVQNEPGIEGQDGYDEFLAIENEGFNDKEIGIEYVFGSDVNTEELSSEYGDESGGDLEPDEVVELFQFEIGSGDEAEQISPDGDDVTQAQFATVEGGEIRQINLNIDLNEGVADTLSKAADGESLFDGGIADDFELIEEIRVGTIEEGD